MKFIFISVVVAALGADVELPASPAAKRAQSVYEMQMRWVRGQHQQAMMEAQTKLDAAEKEALAEYEKQMKAALDIALKNKDLEEANRISEAIKAGGGSKSTIADGAYLADVYRNEGLGRGLHYRLEWLVKDGKVAETKYISEAGVNVHRDLSWKIIESQESGSFVVKHDEWGYDTWHPFANGKGFAYERLETKGKVPHVGIAKKIR